MDEEKAATPARKKFLTRDRRGRTEKKVGKTNAASLTPRGRRGKYHLVLSKITAPGYPEDT